MSVPESVRYGQIDHDYATRLATTPAGDDGPVWMVNLMSYRDAADYGQRAEPTISGREADDRYAPFESLAAVGAEIVFVGDVESQFFNETPTWDRVAVVKYPTRRSFIEMQARPEYQEKHVHKDAGMEQTIVMGCQPIDSPAFSAHGPDWAHVPHPPTDDDPAVMVLHVLRFTEGEALTDMQAYFDHASQIAGPHGARVAGWFGVEGTIVGDGRQWDQARFNAFPSREAFMAVALDPERLQAQADHREVAIADTYTMILRPGLDRLQVSLPAS